MKYSAEVRTLQHFTEHDLVLLCNLLPFYFILLSSVRFVWLVAVFYVPVLNKKKTDLHSLFCYTSILSDHKCCLNYNNQTLPDTLQSILTAYAAKSLRFKLMVITNKFWKWKDHSNGTSGSGTKKMEETIHETKWQNKLEKKTARRT